MFWQEVYKEKIDCSTSNPYHVRMHILFSFDFGMLVGVDKLLKQLLMNKIPSKVECSQGG